MILQLSEGRFEVLERDDLRRLKLRAPFGWDAAEIQSGLPFEVMIAPDYIWVREADLRELAGDGRGASGQDPIAGMINTARKYGFYDEVRGSVRVHIEFY